MPELPEVEVLRRDLEKEVVTRRIKDVEVRNSRNAMKAIRRHGRRKEFQDLLEGAKVEKVDRIGRSLVIELDNRNVLVIDVGTTGNLIKTSASEEVVTHTHIIIGFTIGGQLRFIDPGQTGEVYVIPVDDLDRLEDEYAGVIDPLTQQFTWQHFSTMLEEMEAPVKELLVDGKFMISLGDIYADEILWTAGLRYDHPSNKMSSQDVRRLYRALMETLQDAVRLRGTTWAALDFKDLHGDPGQYQLELKVFERVGEPCRRCRSEIVEERFQDRPVFLCAQCQS